MNPKEFADILTPLKVRHPNNFSSEVAVELYNIIGHLTSEQGRTIVGKLMLRSRMAPEEKDFKDALLELFRQKQYVQPKIERFDRIFSDDERKEIWQFVKDVAAGKHSKETIKTYTDVLNQTISKFYNR